MTFNGRLPWIPRIRIGATYRGQHVGGHGLADVTVFSFHPVKIITTAEGGLALTQRADVARRMELARSHGMTREPSVVGGTPDGPWSYEQRSLGWNYRLTDLQAALGTSQLRRIEEFLARRHAVRARYDAAFAGLPLVLPPPDAEGRSALHLYPVQLALQLGRDRRAVFEGLRARGIGVNVHYIPIHTQPYYQALGFCRGDFPAAEAYYARAITLPLHAGMSDADVEAVIAAVRAELA